MADKPVGKVTHFFDKVGVAVVDLKAGLKVGDQIKIGKTEFLEQEVTSMQIDHKNIEKAKKGQEIGMKVSEKVRQGDLVFKV